MSDPMGPMTMGNKTEEQKDLERVAALLSQRAQNWAAKSEEAYIRELNELQRKQEAERREQDRITTDTLHQRAQGYAARWAERLRLKLRHWVDQNRTTATPTVHSRAFYAEHLLESATLITQMSRKAESQIASDNDATQTMQDWAYEVDHLVMLAVLMLERQRMVTAEKVAKRMTERRPV